MQDLIHCRMYILAAITGIQVGSTAKQYMASTGHLVLLTTPIITVFIWLVHV
ncbi:hypothetical protein IKE88_00765 [Candidatus Saccharibacteria bacterium]|nr:hypothetical protein [Candidatus Saccharibacteria bacterium]